MPVPEFWIVPFFEKYNFDLAAFEEQAGGYYYPEERSLTELKEFIEHCVPEIDLKNVKYVTPT